MRTYPESCGSPGMSSAISVASGSSVDEIASFRFFSSQLIANGTASQSQISRAFGGWSNAPHQRRHADNHPTWLISVRWGHLFYGCHHLRAITTFQSPQRG
ncbi:MAG: hypothetical protein K9N23_11285 [Akkermansiaceae bacterium]|nr:hypothetical protein [Akkermansiaceae bacterium]MCF7732266.1 hypothetical protein [Akkermansiaceae bacterium]